MTMRADDKESIIVSVRFSPREYEKAQRMWRSVRQQCPTFSGFIRLMVLTGQVTTTTAFTDPAEVNGAVNRVGRNIDDLLRLARYYGIEPGETQALADQMADLNKALKQYWNDYSEARDKATAQ